MLDQSNAAPDPSPHPRARHAYLIGWRPNLSSDECTEALVTTPLVKSNNDWASLLANWPELDDQSLDWWRNRGQLGNRLSMAQPQC